MKSNIKVYDLDTNVKPNVATEHLTLELFVFLLTRGTTFESYIDF